MTPSRTSTSTQSHFQGIARKVTFRTAQHSYGSSPTTTQILNFRLELTDNHGDIVAVKSVELRGENIFGFISDGDTVEVFGKDTKIGIAQPRKIFNVTTGAEIVSEQQAGCLGCLIVLLSIPMSFIFYQVLLSVFGSSVAIFAVFGILTYFIYLASTHTYPFK